MHSLTKLVDYLPQQGVVTWMGVRPKHKAPMVRKREIVVSPEFGLTGERYSKVQGSKQVTIVQDEHLSVIGSLLGQPPIKPELLRRNLLVKGMNLLALKNRDFFIGDVMFRATGLCHPCSKMEVALGDGGYSAVRGHGGINATVLSEGIISIGDKVKVI